MKKKWKKLDLKKDYNWIKYYYYERKEAEWHCNKKRKEKYYYNDREEKIKHCNSEWIVKSYKEEKKKMSYYMREIRFLWLIMS